MYRHKLTPTDDQNAEDWHDNRVDVIDSHRMAEDVSKQKYLGKELESCDGCYLPGAELRNCSHTSSPQPLSAQRE